MSRALRIEYEGAWYHVMNRGAGRRFIFHNDNFKRLFLDLLDECNHRYQLETHCYCIMGNHYHLLVRTPAANLSCAMRHLNGVFALKYNQIKNSDGPIFKNRFKSIIVDAENYLLHLSRYIHLNPVSANMVDQAQDYPWSSYQAYLGKSNKPDYLICNEILRRFGRKQQRIKYRLFTEEGVDKNTASFYQMLRKAPILGSKAFRESLSEKYLKNRPVHPEVPEHKHTNASLMPEINTIIDVVANHYRIDRKELHLPLRSGNLARSIAIFLATDLTNLTFVEIAKTFNGISYSGVSKVKKRMLAKINQDLDLGQLVLMLKNRLSG